MMNEMIRWNRVEVLYGSHYWPDWWLFVFERAYVSRISIPGGGGRMDGQHCGVIITTGRRWYCVRARGQWNDLGMMYRGSNNACSEPWPRSPIHPIECIIVLRSQWTTLCEAFVLVTLVNRLGLSIADWLITGYRCRSSSSSVHASPGWRDSLVVPGAGRHGTN